MTDLDPTSTQELLELLDKQKLYENLMLYCRGMDRKDLDLLKSTFWPDATEKHGAFSGRSWDFCDWAYENQKASGHTSLHHCENLLIEFINGDQAKRECVHFYVMARPGKTTVVLAGRYWDLCEKRSGQWKVLRRDTIYDWAQELPETPDLEALIGIPPTANFAALYPHDRIYRDW